MMLRFLCLAFLLYGKCVAQSVVAKLPSSPTRIAVDPGDNLVVHIYGGRIIRINPAGEMSFISEDIRKGMRAPLPGCTALAIDAQGGIFMADTDLIWKVTGDGKVTLFAGVPFKSQAKDGTLHDAQFREIQFMEIDQTGNIFVADRDDTNKDNLGDFFLIRKISPDGTVRTIVNTRENPDLKTKWISGMGVDKDGNVLVSDGSGRCIKKISPAGIVSVVAGMCGKREFHPVYVQGDISRAELMAPQDILTNHKGEIIFSDGRLNRIIKVADNKVTTIAGNSAIQPNNVNMGGRSREGYLDGPASIALFNFPQGCDIAIDSKQNIYIIDGGNDCIRKLSTSGMVTTIGRR